MIALPGHHDPALADFNPTYVKWGEVGKILKSLKANGSAELVIAGTVTRPDMRFVHPDIGFFRALPTVLRLIYAGGDDAVLRGVVEYFEAKGVKIVGPGKVAPELLISNGTFTHKDPPQHIATDIELGFRVIGALAPFDVGQSVVVTDGQVEALEAVEGTDAMLEQVYNIRRQRPTSNPGKRKGVLVKRPKPGQELRVDLPVIGPRTVFGCVEAGLEGIAVEANSVLAVSQQELYATAEMHDLFIVGLADNERTPTSDPILSYETKEINFKTIGGRNATRLERNDACKGAQVIAILNQFNTGRRLIISRGHVLAVETNDSLDGLFRRASKLRQWGDWHWRRRSGVAVLSAPHLADQSTVCDAANAGLSGIAVCPRRFSAPLRKDIIKLANRKGLFIAEVGTPGVIDQPVKK